MHTEKDKIEFLKHLEPELQGLSRYARAISGDSDDAKDIVSETVLRAYENFGKIRDKTVFKSYLFTIATRYYRRSKKRLSIFQSIDNINSEKWADNGTKPDIAPDVEFLYKMMSRLPQEQQEALALFEISGFKISEISEIQSVTESAVKSRLKRGREKLTELMTENISKKNISGEKVNDMNLTHSGTEAKK